MFVCSGMQSNNFANFALFWIQLGTLFPESLRVTTLSICCVFSRLKSPDSSLTTRPSSMQFVELAVAPDSTRDAQQHGQ